MERMDKGDLLHIGTAYVEIHTFKGKDYVTVRDFSTTTNALSKEILELEEENKKLKSDYDRLDKVASENVRTLDELEAERIELAEENKELNIKVSSLEGEIKGLNYTIEKLQKEIEELEKQYQHSMGFSDFGGYDE